MILLAFLLSIWTSPYSLFMPAPRASGNCAKCHMPYNSARALREHYDKSIFCDPKKARTDVRSSDSQEAVESDSQSVDNTTTTTETSQEQPSLQQHVAEQSIECKLYESNPIHYIPS
jgi:hypothetical protein